MRLGRFFRRIVELGRQADPRRLKKGIRGYADSALLYGDPRREIKKILVGIDIEGPELLLADRIRSREGLDLVMAHHPEGAAFAGLHEVMRMQAELLVQLGIERRVADALLEERSRQVQRSVSPANHMRAVDMAKLLDLPFVCAHTPADNHVASYLESLMRRNAPKTVEDIVDILNTQPEYRQASLAKAAPRVLLGSPKRRVGKICVEMTGGTEGNKDTYSKLYASGIRTLICMHLSEEHFKKVRDASLNVVIAGHISSDTLGMNLLLDNLEKEGRFTIIECSGFRRFKRD